MANPTLARHRVMSVEEFHALFPGLDELVFEVSRELSREDATP